ncbi:alpha-D-ribose 1-methylphosphonate 5-triphosphate diphosphatase [Consotaella aegiceratis]|uniref:alpha-D-ribose 1-methylphosphonate 5-triphosphate diphosphatase n=1 Tax=Consotaella aegiceratis TaxID=3097961 RepID=UPI002F420F66
MTNEFILENARVVLPESVIDGYVVVRDGQIAEIGEGRVGSGENLEGDTLIPGLVELHTDHIENHFLPRPTVRWNKMAAVQAHDAQIAASGITTVFDALRVGTDGDSTAWAEEMRAMAETIGEAVDEGRLRADHYIHLRCEVSADDVVEDFDRIAGNERIRLVSLMDHAPGQRQFRDIETYRLYYQAKMKLSDPEFETFCRERVAQSERNSPANRTELASRCRERGITLASHDDATQEHVAESIALGIHLAEFPTTLEAAAAARQAGMMTLMGAPNVVRGGSHSGNIAALDLHRRDLLSILSSDYVPFSLLQAVFLMAEEGEAELPDALRLVTGNPADAVGLTDRGRIALGLRADLVRIRAENDKVPVVRGVWREGRRVA